MAVSSLAQDAAERTDKGLTAVGGIKVGHHTLTERPTGCTVILAEAGAVAGVDVRGGAPGTRETDLLDPVNMVQTAHAVVLSGGSAFGLDSASGAVRYLDEKKIGFPVGPPSAGQVVPIVASAILFDLFIGDKPQIRPGADCGYKAAAAATTAAVAEGNVGAGAGATVGKLGPRGRAMKSGLGSASVTLPDGLTVAALVAVNAVGDVIDPATGKVVAGLRTADGRGLADARKLVRSGALNRPRAERGAPSTNTTIGLVATNASLTQAEATKIAQMAHDGLARTIVPIHTPLDGDTLFALATGTHDGPGSVLAIGALAADVMAEAVLRAVHAAEGIPGLPAAADLEGAGAEGDGVTGERP
ncbi:MAG: P1 family peptidase [Acidobacteriota bacterium]